MTVTTTTSPLHTVAALMMERRTVKQFLPQPVARETLQQLIDLAVWAPNHRLNEPWRFYVLGEGARTQLAQIAGAITQRKILEAGGEAAVAERKGAEAGAAWLSVPTLLYITYLTDPNPEISLENYGAVCCAIQNLTLAAHALSIGTSWSSGAVAAAPELLTLVGATAAEQMAGLFRVGYLDPALAPGRSRRSPGTLFTQWLDDSPTA
ncbi:MAG: nitroreductase [Caldilineaceae bacterium]|nr:nitroreductase [Caldilineaceae bacterium]